MDYRDTNWTISQPNIQIEGQRPVKTRQGHPGQCFGGTGFGLKNSNYHGPIFLSDL